MENAVLPGRRLSSRQSVLALALVLAGVFAFLRLRPDSQAGAPGARSRARGTAVTDVPAIGLARLDVPQAASAAGKRNLFEFGAAAAPQDEEPDEEPDDAPMPPPREVPSPEVTAPPGPRLAAINLKYIGTLEAEGGLKVAVLLTDRNEILYGQVGQQVANRFKILRIGHESVELLDEGSGQSRRIPLKGS